MQGLLIILLRNPRRITECFGNPAENACTEFHPSRALQCSISCCDNRCRLLPGKNKPVFLSFFSLLFSSSPVSFFCAAPPESNESEKNGICIFLLLFESICTSAMLFARINRMFPEYFNILRVIPELLIISL